MTNRFDAKSLFSLCFPFFRGFSSVQTCQFDLFSTQKVELFSLNNIQTLYLYILIFSYFATSERSINQLVTVPKNSFYNVKNSFYNVKNSFYNVKNSFYNVKNINKNNHVF